MKTRINYFEEVNPHWKENDFKIKDIESTDAKSITLIRHMILFWNKRCESYNNVQNVEQEVRKNAYDDYYIKLGEIRMTCDFIAPSVYHAQKQGLSQKEIKSYVYEGRYFGGHMVWPSAEFFIDRYYDNGEEIKKSINTGKSYCFKERIDYTIFDIRNWYNHNYNNMHRYFKIILDGNSLWLNQFGKGDEGYRKFIDFFILSDFVNQEYEPYDLSSYNSQNKTYRNIIRKHPYPYYKYVPQGKEEYQNLVSGCSHFIDKRTDKMIKVLESAIK